MQKQTANKIKEAMSMKEDPRGKFVREMKTREKKKNLLMVESWTRSNPEGNMKECSVCTGLSYTTVRTHTKTLKAQGKI